MHFPTAIILAATVSNLICGTANACIWDADTLADEKKKSPKMAEVILGPAPAPPDPVPLRARIKTLKAEPHEDDPAWWNDLAGAYLRLGEAAEAAKLLESLVSRFPNDYGIHANLGTAYHLVGRYKEAEREIARDLEINPEGHFGLEKYHLALLQYLSRDAGYQKQHVYVDEFTAVFTGTNEWTELDLMPPRRFFGDTNAASDSPAYRSKWNLADDPNLKDGAIYMASLNPNEPACFVLLGIVCLSERGYDRDLNLAAAGFQKAIQLGSPQKDILSYEIALIEGHIYKAHGIKQLPRNLAIMFGLVILGIVGFGLFILWVWRKVRARR